MKTSWEGAPGAPHSRSDSRAALASEGSGGRCGRREAGRQPGFAGARPTGFSGAWAGSSHTCISISRYIAAVAVLSASRTAGGHTAVAS